MTDKSAELAESSEKGVPQPTVFLDRDGVLNRQLPDDYVKKVEELELLEGVLEALAMLQRAGFRLAVVTNQRGIALGLMSEEDLLAVHAALAARCAAAGVRLDEFYYCPHDRGSCACRKPKPGLFDRAHALHPVDWSRSYMIGDNDSDMEAGAARGLFCIKVGPRDKGRGEIKCANLLAAVRFILSLA